MHSVEKPDAEQGYILVTATNLHTTPGGLTRPKSRRKQDMFPEESHCFVKKAYVFSVNAKIFKKKLLVFFTSNHTKKGG